MHYWAVRTAADLPEGICELVVTGREAWRDQDYDQARRLFEEALVVAREIGDTFGEVTALHFLGNVAFNERKDAESRHLHTRALELSRAAGDDHGIATSLGSIALVDVAEGNLEAARDQFDASAKAYERAHMPEDADRVRETADALLVRSVPLKSLVHRQGCA
jgi:tetratricopeptide (TPR) repeat protein